MRSIPDKKQLKGQTLHVRIAGIDAPERAHFGNPAQPFGDEALNWLKDYIGNRDAQVRLYNIDRYERVVAEVYIWRWGFRRNVGLEMVKAGFADVYNQAGARYGGYRQEKLLREALEMAKRRKRGMWAKGDIELPSEFKKKMKASK